MPRDGVRRRSRSGADLRGREPLGRDDGLDRGLGRARRRRSLQPVFGPAGLLGDRLQKGEAADLFASADLAAPVRVAAGRPGALVVPFVRNRMCVAAKPSVGLTEANMLDKMLAPDLRLATSTPGNDPGGDYALAVFERADALRPGAGKVLTDKALHLVGGPNTMVPIDGRSPSATIFLGDHADLFVYYCSSAGSLLEGGAGPDQPSRSGGAGGAPRLRHDRPVRQSRGGSFRALHPVAGRPGRFGPVRLRAHGGCTMNPVTRSGGLASMSWIRLSILTASAFLATQPGRAEEPQGCDKFRWPIERERAALNVEAMPQGMAGEVRTVSASAFALDLVPIAAATLPRAPERVPKPGTFAGAVTFDAPHPGTYQVALSDAAWIDLIQGSAARKPSAFSGAGGCPGLRKVVRFDLETGTFVLQISGAAENRLRLIVELVPPSSN